MSNFEFDEVFPIIERLIEVEYRTRNDWVLHRHLVAALQEDSQGQLVIEHASSSKSGRDDEWWASNMVAWFSQKISTDESPFKDRFDRKKLLGLWAYKPRGKTVRADVGVPITSFSWGYKNWGNATNRLVEGVDAVEKARGFDRPIFIDIRIQRSVRAEGFRERAFQNFLGPERYVWMKSLGNMRIKTGTGRSVQIADPKAAHDLLDIALEAAVTNRRMIFFCGCQWPKAKGAITCHRTSVANLLRLAASKRQVMVETIEWLGGSPKHVTVAVTRYAFEAARRGIKHVPIETRGKLAALAGLAWGSTVTLECGKDILLRFAGPAIFKGGKWSLPIWESSSPNEIEKVEREAEIFRRLSGLNLQSAF